MPLPLIAIGAALVSGGVLVPHAAGGLIVTGATGYVAGTFVSTATIATALGVAGSGVLAAGGLAATTFSSAVGGVIGASGFMGSQMGATGITGALMAAGVLPATPLAIPVAVIGAGIAGTAAAGYFAFRRKSLARRVYAAYKTGEELVFSEAEAKLVTRILRMLYRRGRLDGPTEAK